MKTKEIIWSTDSTDIITNYVTILRIKTVLYIFANNPQNMKVEFCISIIDIRDTSIGTNTVCSKKPPYGLNKRPMGLNALT